MADCLAAKNDFFLVTLSLFPNPSFFLNLPHLSTGSGHHTHTHKRRRPHRNRFHLRNDKTLFEAMSDIAFNVDTIKEFARMLDPTVGQANAAMRRPETQSVGYSLAETVDTKLRVGETGDEAKPGDASASGASGGPSHPGGIYVPPQPGAATAHLPTPSQSKAGKEAARARAEAGGAAGGPKPKGNAIWDSSEIAASAQSATGAPVVRAGAVVDPRETPTFEVLYKQRSGAEDVYLGVDFERDGSVAMTCDELLVRVHLPKLQTSADLELDVSPLVLKLRTKDYVLAANLPEKVVANKGGAKWDAAKKLLQVTLTVDMEGRKMKLMQ